MSETQLEVNTIINNIIVSIMTIHQRGTQERKTLREFLVSFGLELDELNNDVLRVIQNIHSMTKEELQKELIK